MALPKYVKIVEVGPRDGLQNESVALSADIKIEFVNRLSETGLQVIEAGSFVSPQWVPQMANSDEVLAGIARNKQVNYSALVPNDKGVEKAIQTKVDEIGIFTAVSNTFCKKNINCSIEESIKRYTPLIEKAKVHSLRVRAYISCVLGCPYEGEIKAEKVAILAQELLTLGVDEISLGDTIGIGRPNEALTLINAVQKHIPLDKLAVHFHNTYGQALANIYAVLQEGIHIIDASVAGLGGCPYATGASGNVATEDVIYLLEGLGIETGIDNKKLIDAGHYICQQLNIRPRSHLGLINQR